MNTALAPAIVPLVKVSDTGRVSVIHRAEWDATAPLGAPAARTLCGRPTAGMLSLSRMTAWERVGWEAASAGPCQACSRKESIRKP